MGVRWCGNVAEWMDCEREMMDGDLGNVFEICPGDGGGDVGGERWWWMKIMFAKLELLCDG